MIHRFEILFARQVPAAWCRFPAQWCSLHLWCIYWHLGAGQYVPCPRPRCEAPGARQVACCLLAKHLVLVPGTMCLVHWPQANWPVALVLAHADGGWHFVPAIAAPAWCMLLAVANTYLMCLQGAHATQWQQHLQQHQCCNKVPCACTLCKVHRTCNMVQQQACFACLLLQQQ